MEETTKTILDKLPTKWSLAILAVLGFIITIYSTFIKKDYPQLEYEILSKVSVFNHQEEVSSLRILLDTVDVQKSNANITFYTIKISNNGTMHINHDMYDKSPFGLQVKNAYVVKGPTIIKASNNYLKSRLEEMSSIKDSDFYSIPYLPLDIGDFFIIRLGLYHEKSNMPSFTSKGKISGQKQINIIDLSNAKKEPFFKNTIYGKWYVQIARLIIYGLGLVIFIVGVLSAYVVISNLLSKWKRQRLVRSLNNLITDRAKQDYIKFGEYYISSIYNVVSLSSTKLNSNYNASKNYIDNLSNSNNKEHLFFHQHRIDTYDNLVERGYLEKQKNKIVIDLKQKKSITILYNLLKSKNIVG